MRKESRTPTAATSLVTIICEVFYSLVKLFYCPSDLACSCSYLFSSYMWDQILLIILNHVWCCSRWHDTMVFTLVRFRWNNWTSFISALTAIFAFQPKYFSLTEFRPKYSALAEIFLKLLTSDVKKILKLLTSDVIVLNLVQTPTKLKYKFKNSVNLPKLQKFWL